MKILVTGATGFIGTALCKYLLDKKHTVNYLTITASDIRNTTPDFKGFLWNPAKNEIDIECLDGVEAIVNLAGHNINCKWNQTNKALILNSRTDSSDTLFKALQENEHQVKYVLSASAIGIYESSYNNCYDENNQHYGTDFLAEVCKKWETANQRFEQLGRRKGIARLGLVLSKNKGVLAELSKVVTKGLGACLGTGRQWMSWIHKDDVVGAVDFLLQRQSEGTFNLVAPRPLTQKEFLYHLSKKLNRPLWLPNVPDFILKVILGERAVLVLSSQWVTSSKLENHGYPFLFSGLESALKEIYIMKQ